MDGNPASPGVVAAGLLAFSFLTLGASLGSRLLSVRPKQEKGVSFSTLLKFFI